MKKAVAKRKTVAPEGKEQPENKGRRYREGELELILSLAPTRSNIDRLASSLGRSVAAIEIVYRIAYFPEAPFGRAADVQRMKIELAKKAIGLYAFK